MAPASLPEKPSELVYVPGPSAKPALAAAGLALIVAGLAVGWVPMVIGALLFLMVLRLWVGDVRGSISRMPRRQRPVTAVVPPVTRRRPAGE
jgi:hypothetical protein